MEVGAIARPQANRVDGRVDEAKRTFAVGHGLLIHQRQIARPTGRCETRSTPSSRASAVVANVIVRVPFCGNVGAIAIGLRSFVGSGDNARSLLPTGDGNPIWRNTAATVGVQAVSDFQAPPALTVVKSVPPTEVTYASSAGKTYLDLVRYASLSPEATNRF